MYCKKCRIIRLFFQYENINIDNEHREKPVYQQINQQTMERESEDYHWYSSLRKVVPAFQSLQGIPAE